MPVAPFVVAGALAASLVLVLGSALPAGPRDAVVSAPASERTAERIGPAADRGARDRVDGSYTLPVAEARVMALFDAPARPWGAGHRGVDLEARAADPVRSPGPGVVAFVGRVVDRDVVAITHPDGLRTSLEPVTGIVAVGMPVDQGQAVGTVQGEVGSHCAPSECVHWGVRRGQAYLDPLTLLPRADPVVLLPVPGR